MSEPDEPRAERYRRVWCCYHTDGSDYVLFGSELPALRYATEHGMSCQPVKFGESLRQQLDTWPTS